MTVSTYDASHRGWSTHGQHPSQSNLALTDKYEVLKDIGDGSFGSVALARVRGAGAHIARRGTLVAIKTMKKTFESFSACLDLREVIFLQNLPHHVHLVPALDIFLDPLSKKLHIAMEYMDGNLYQLMKARDHKPFDPVSVKSILYQILSGLEHIHMNGFFHRDIKPENILVTVSAREDLGGAFRRYSQLVTPPSTPPTYSIKLADFGLAREIHSKTPYTTYVSTRWYRAPEVLLRAGEYSAPVDIWAIGAMAVEIATLKPLFPGSDEVDQVWRVCEIMGSPGNWVNKQGVKVGGGPWKEGVKLASKLGFSFPKMTPHTMESFLQQPQWPASLCHFVTWCLMWDPASRPTSTQSLCHEYFADAQDPLRPKSSTSRLSRKGQEGGNMYSNQSIDSTTSLSSRTSSWFRKSLVARESAPVLASHSQPPPSPRMSPVKDVVPHIDAKAQSSRPQVSKRATWAHGNASQGAPMPILPSIRPVSPLSNTVTAQAPPHQRAAGTEQKVPRKLGRQLSTNSTGNHYADIHRQEAERALNGGGGLMSPSNGQKESFFSHLRKRARRLSGRHQTPISLKAEEFDAAAPYVQWQNANAHQSNMQQDSHIPVGAVDPSCKPEYADLDKALQNVRYSIDPSTAAVDAQMSIVQPTPIKPHRHSTSSVLKRNHSIGQVSSPGAQEAKQYAAGQASPSVLSRTLSNRARRVAQKPILPSDQYEVPDEQEELLDEAMTSAQAVASRLDGRHQHETCVYPDAIGSQADHYQRQQQRYHHQQPQQQQQQQQQNNRQHQLRQAASEALLPAPYPTPSPSAKRNSVGFGYESMAPNAHYYQTPSKPIEINQQQSSKQQQQQLAHSGFIFPTPPYEENEWANSAKASIYAATGDHWR